MKKTLLICLVMLAASAGRMLGHGIHVDSKLLHQTVTTTSLFSANQPVANGMVSIFSPDDQENPYQTGKTDKYGRFIFIPDKAGDWGFVVDDQKGHIEKTTIMIPGDFFISGEETSVSNSVIAETDVHEHDHEHETPMLYKILTGLSLIFGITGIFYGVQAKKASRK